MDAIIVYQEILPYVPKPSILISCASESNVSCLTANNTDVHPFLCC